ncbi:hypothetical protein LEP1GSC108_0840 [Leptospira weilii str. UI 13098]|uniref:Uncharacterized protein n=1 Tax=Leptospira weilii str. UI 13098 TaxID=1088542 RepID=M6PYB6_9LEPT|nr:hypothetical protein LEP1GSC108_0840 [Leptospira weilii str. UI 13098]
MNRAYCTTIFERFLENKGRIEFGKRISTKKHKLFIRLPKPNKTAL